MDINTILLGIIAVPIVVPLVGLFAMGLFVALMWLIEHAILQLSVASYVLYTGLHKDQTGMIIVGIFLFWGIWSAYKLERKQQH